MRGQWCLEFPQKPLMLGSLPELVSGGAEGTAAQEGALPPSSVGPWAPPTVKGMVTATKKRSGVLTLLRGAIEQVILKKRPRDMGISQSDMSGLRVPQVSTWS